MSAPVRVDFKDFYVKELRALRERAADFAREHPDVAHELALGRGGAGEPHVELLLESFAFLAARLQYRCEAERNSIPNALLAQLYPHLQAPLPSMMIGKVEVNPANFGEGWTLGRHRYLHAVAQSDSNESIKCRLRTCYETPIWPLEVKESTLESNKRYSFDKPQPACRSVLRARIEISPSVKQSEAGPTGRLIQNLPLERLRFYLHGNDIVGYKLYELLSVHLIGVALFIPPDSKASDAGPSDATAGSEGDNEEGPNAKILPLDSFRWLGFSNDEAALPSNPQTHPGYRILQEYFAFPEKFLFCEIAGIDPVGAVDSLEILFLLDSDQEHAPEIPADALALNCVPLINLYVQPLEPIALDHHRHEYRLVGRRDQHRYCEIYQLETLTVTRPGASPRRVPPYFELEHHYQTTDADCFYATRRTQSHLPGVPGTELYASFVDLKLDIALPPAETIGGRALCTNRRLPERLREGDALHLEGAGPVLRVRVATKPSAHYSPMLLGAQPWALVSQLSLNHLSLSAEPDAVEPLKRIIRLHVGTLSAGNLKQIDSIVGVRCRPAVRRLGAEPWRGFCQGVEVHVAVEERFYHGSAVLLGEVLRRFFGLYADVNTFTQVVLQSQQRKGDWKTFAPLIGDATLDLDPITHHEVPKVWPPLTGAQPVL